MTYLDQLDNVRKQNKGTATVSAVTVMAVPQDPETLLKEVYRFAHTRYKRLPSNSKTRAGWVRNLCGLLLADLGVGSAQSINPIAVPEEFKVQRGRPALKATA